MPVGITGLSAALLLGFMAGLCWTLVAILAVEGTKKINPFIGSFVSQIAAVPIAIVAVLAFGQLYFLGQLSPFQVIALIVAGFLNFVAGRTLLYFGVRSIGAAKTQPITQLQVVLSPAVAAVVLQESLGPKTLIGLALALTGMFVIAISRTR